LPIRIENFRFRGKLALTAKCSLRSVARCPRSNSPNHERPEIRLPPVAEEPRLHLRGRCGSCRKHRRYNHRFCFDQCGLPEAVAARYHEGSQPIFYRALEKAPGIEIAESSLVVRAAVSPETLYKPIAHALNAPAAGPGMPRFFNLQEVLRTGRAGDRTVMLYLSIFAAVGLFLAAVGLYGVLAYSVARRTREIGIRMALGAQIADVTRLILRQGLVLVAVGGVIGIAVALATGRVLRAYLFGVSSTDPVTFIAVGLLLGAVALFACWLPARRATRVNPMEALRYE